MDPERDPEDRRTAEDERPPAEAELVTAAEPDAEVAVAYAAWRIEHGGDRR